MDEMLKNSRILIFFIIYVVIFNPILSLLVTGLNFINIQPINLVREFISQSGFHIFVVIWIFYNIKTYKIDLKELIGKTYPVTKYIKYIWLTPFIVLLAINLSVFIAFLLSLDPYILQKLESLNHPINYYSHLILALFIAPCIEEIFFRRIMLQRFIIKWGINQGIIYSSLIFMLAHSYRGGLDSLIFSIVVSIIFLKTRMVSVCVFFHFITNIISESMLTDKYLNLLSHVAGINSNINTLTDMAKLLTSSKIIGILAIVIIFSLLIIVLFLYKNWPKENLETISLN